MVDLTAQVAPGAVVHPEATIGPGCLIGPEVEVGAGATLGDRVALLGRVRVGPGAILSRGVTVGPPQHLAHLDSPHATEIGAEVVAREFVTIHGATGAEPTRVGPRSFLMAYSHVGHDCQLGADVVLTNVVQLAGHVRVGDGAVLGGGVMVHQRLEIGERSMVAGMSAVRASVPPFTLVAGDAEGCTIRGPNRYPFRADKDKRARVVNALALWRRASGRAQALAALAALEDEEAGALAAFLERCPTPCRWAQ